MKTQDTRYRWPAVELEPAITSGALTVFPIRGDGDAPADYILLSDAVAKGIARVKETGPGGEVPAIVIENHGDKPILGIQGEEYVGAKQNRTLNVTVLVRPGKTKIPVSCVEQGRWDMGGAMHSFGIGSLDYMELRRAKSEYARKMRKAPGKMTKFGSDQASVWKGILGLNRKYRVGSPTMAMKDIYEKKDVRKGLDDVAGGIEMPADARGAVIGMGGRVVAMDLFESPFVFQRIWPRLLKSYAISALGRKGTPPSPEAAETFAAQPATTTWNATPSVDLGEDVRWEDKTFMASALVWQDRFLHSLAFATE